MAETLQAVAELLASRIFHDVEELKAFLVAWDELAVERSQPYSAPAWVLGWWAHMRPENVELSTILVWKGDLLIGVVPLFCTGSRYYPTFTDGMAATEPLARRGFEREVAQQAALRLAETAPTEIELTLSGRSPDWARLLSESWPGKRRVRVGVKSSLPLPRVNIDAGFDEWLGGRSKKFRQEVRQKQRKFEKAGGTFRYSTRETLPGDVEAFLRMHRARHAGKRQTSLAADGFQELLTAIGSELVESGRFKLLNMELDGKPIAARVVMSTGDELSMWNSGFDDEYSKFSPSVISMVRAVADGVDGRDELHVGLGPGGQAYKYRVSNEEDALTTYVLLPFGRGYPLARARLAVAQLRQRVSKRLSSNAKRRIRGLLGLTG